MPVSDRREDADAVPYEPVTSSTKLPVDVRTAGTAALTTGAAKRLKAESLKPVPGMQTLQTDTIKDELPIMLGSRNATAESDDHLVDGDADL